MKKAFGKIRERITSYRPGLGNGVRATLWLALALVAGKAHATRLWLSAEQATALTPWMVSSATVELQDDKALGGFIAPIIAIGQPDDKLESEASFVLNVPRAGIYRLWARLRSPRGQDEAFAIVDGGTGQGSLRGTWINQPPTNRGWHWQPLRVAQATAVGSGAVVKLELPKGKWRFRIRTQKAGATVYGPQKWKQAEPTFSPRIDALCLTDEADYQPNDQDARAALGAKPRHHPVPRAKEAVLPGPGDALPDRKLLPDWMRVPRWYTKDSWRDELAHRNPGDIRLLVRQVAANGGQTIRLGCYWGGEAYFQSQVAPHAPGLGRLDYLREAVDEGARVGVKVMVYMNPNAFYPGHPLFEECVVRDAEGRLSEHPAYGGHRPGCRYTCINHPRYRQFIRDVLTEIFTRYKADGLYVDGLTPHVCFCEHCRRKYAELFDEPMPVDKLSEIRAGWAVWAEFGSDPQPMGDVENDPDARRWTEMFYRVLGEVTHEVSQTVKAANPDAVTAFHTHPKPNSIDAYEATLTEVYSPRPWVHTAWRAAELAGYSSAVPVPVLFNVYPHQHYTAREARLQGLQGLANGAYPNYWSTPGMKPVFDFMARNAAALDFSTTEPVKFLALPRDLRSSPTQSAAPLTAGVSYKQNRFLAPYVGAYSALMRSGVPIVTLHRPRFEQSLAGFRVLCLANVGLMSDTQVEAVRQFVLGGGGLLATHETSLYDEKGNRRPDFALAGVLGVHYQGTVPSATRTIRFAQHAVTDGLVDGAGVLHTEPHVATKLAGATAAGWLGGEDTASRSIPALTVHSYGKGRVVYLPGRLDAAQCVELSGATERLFANAVNWLANGMMPVEAEAPGVIGVSLYRQSSRLLVHLLNYQRDSLDRSDEIRPISEPIIRVRLPHGATATSVRALWSNAELSHEQQADMVTIHLPDLGEYELLTVDWK